MRVLRVEKKLLKVLSISFFLVNSIAPISGLSNEILFILVAQETAKLPNVKVGGLSKSSADQPYSRCAHAAWVRVPDLFFISPTLTSGCFAAL